MRNQRLPQPVPEYNVKHEGVDKYFEDPNPNKKTVEYSSHSPEYVPTKHEEPGYSICSFSSNFSLLYT